MYRVSELFEKYLELIFLKINVFIRFVLDAIPLLKTDGGIALMAELFKAGGISESTQDIWFSTLPFYKNPSRSMVGSVLVSFLFKFVIYATFYVTDNFSFLWNIISNVFYKQEFINVPNVKPRHSALLGVSSLVHTFCMAANECEKLSQVQEVNSYYFLLCIVM